MKAAVYARYSSDKQRGESIDDQIRVCTEFAEREGMEVCAIYADAAQSGTSDLREQFQQMVSDSEDAEWRRLIVYKLDRFARDRYASAIYRKRLRENGVKVVSATEGIPDTPEGILMEAVIEGFGEYYSKQLGQNVRRGMEGNARRCLVNGVRLYGYQTAPDGTYEVKEPEASHIREAFRMRADGYRIGSIARELAPKVGRTYKQTYGMLRDAFSNQKYKGDYKWGDVYVPDGMPAIVTASEFDAVQRMRGNVRMKSKRADYPLAGRIVGSDGKRFHGESAKSGRYFYYSDGEFRISRDLLDGMVSDAIRECMRDDRLLDRLARGTAAAARRFDRPGRTEAEVEHDMENVADAIARIGADESLLKRMSALRCELEDVRMFKMKEAISNSILEEDVRGWIEDFVDRGSAEALDAFVDLVTIDHEGRDVKGITIRFNWHKTSEPDALDEFALESFGTPSPKISNVRLYTWGFEVDVAA